MEFIGLDYHKQYSVATKIKSDGSKEQCRLNNTPDEFSRYFDTEEETSVVFESSRGWPYLYEMIKNEVDFIKMAHPLKVKAIASARIKTDKIDSNILAMLLKADLIPESHLREEENRTHLKILRQRAYFVRIRTSVRNRIHIHLDEQPYEIRLLIPQVSSLWGKKGMEWMKTLRLPIAEHQQLLKAMLGLMKHLTAQIKVSDGLVAKLYAKDPDAQILSSIPGLGKFGAVMVSNEIDGIKRFDSAKNLVCYAGLVPSTYSSGGRTYHGSIIKQGSKWLRWMFIQAVSPAVRSNVQLSNYYERIKRRKGTKAARVATARRLLTVAFSCLKGNRTFVPWKSNQPKKLFYLNDRAALVNY